MAIIAQLLQHLLADLFMVSPCVYLTHCSVGGHAVHAGEREALVHAVVSLAKLISRGKFRPRRGLNLARETRAKFRT
jgi:hypothetical protein